MQRFTSQACTRGKTPGNSKPLIYPEDRYIVAVASDIALPDCKLPQLNIDDVPAIAEFIIRHCGLKSSRQTAAQAT